MLKVPGAKRERYISEVVLLSSFRGKYLKLSSLLGHTANHQNDLLNMYKVAALAAIILCALVIAYAVSIYLETRKMYPKKDPKALRY